MNTVSPPSMTMPSGRVADVHFVEEKDRDVGGLPRRDG
jgi:hypothetical protein